MSSFKQQGPRIVQVNINKELMSSHTTSPEPYGENFRNTLEELEAQQHKEDGITELGKNFHEKKSEATMAGEDCAALPELDTIRDKVQPAGVQADLSHVRIMGKSRVRNEL